MGRVQFTDKNKTDILYWYACQSDGIQRISECLNIQGVQSKYTDVEEYLQSVGLNTHREDKFRYEAYRGSVDKGCLYKYNISKDEIEDFVKSRKRDIKKYFGVDDGESARTNSKVKGNYSNSVKIKNNTSKTESTDSYSIDPIELILTILAWVGSGKTSGFIHWVCLIFALIGTTGLIISILKHKK